MMLLGLLLLAAGAVLVIGGVFTADVDLADVSIFGIDTSATVLFLLGLVAGACLLLGASVTKWGAKRQLKQRKEQKKIDELSEKLDKAEAGRRRDLDDPDLRARASSHDQRAGPARACAERSPL